ncbi:MAG TPA: ABC transporter transmembrane domain-containing protein [Anaeromyxobacter sp.]|nr:ABC transporter transmembrane domain-containing protein [Anaeromyxobacter sp.]
MRTYLRLLRFAAPYRWRILAAVGCMLVFGAGTAAYAYLLGPALKFLIGGGEGGLQVRIPFLDTVHAPGGVLQLDRRQALAALPIAILAVTVLKGIAYFGQHFLMSTTGQRVVADVRKALFAHLLRLSPSFYTRRHSGDLLQRFSADVNVIESAVTNAVVAYLRDGITVVLMLVTCFVMNWKMSLVAFGAIPVMLFPIVRLAKRLKKVTGRARQTGGELLEMVQEAVSGIRVVQAYGMEGWEAKRYGDANSRLLKILRRGVVASGFSSPLMEVMAASGLAAAIWWVGGLIVRGALPADQFLSFVAAVLLLYTPVKQLGRQGQTILHGAVSAERIFELLDTPSQVLDAGTRTLSPLREAVRYEGVSFRYAPDKPLVLSDLTLEIRRGEVVALVGSSGGGKTTVANLLPRFWDPTAGRITIDGVDLRDVTLRSLREQIAVVTQETLLFNDTVRANIAYGRPEVPLAEVERAARLAQAHDFIQGLPQGYDTMVGERGSLLSGGQRQRIAIARAFLKDAPLLILDEATSALDAEAEREVQRALDTLMNERRAQGQAEEPAPERAGGLGGRERGEGPPSKKARTTLVIAHRLSTIRDADRILVISGGRVVEAGPHEELLARGGEYARLYRAFDGSDRAGARVGHG